MKRNRYVNKKTSVASQAANIPNIKPEWAFLVLALAAGLFMVFVTPPFQSPDEDAHFFRAFQLSEGKIIAQREGSRVGGNIPSKVALAAMPFERMQFRPLEKVDRSVVRSLLKEPFAAEPRVWRDFMHTAIYSPVAYAPAVVGIWVGKLCGASALGMMYASRVATLLCWAAMVFFAIRATPVFKWVGVLTGLLPMGVFLAASSSADVMTNGFAMLLTGLMLKSAFAAKAPFNWREGVSILVFSVLLALTKQVYFVLAAMTIMIPMERFAGIKRKAAFLCIVAGAAIAVNIIWAWLVRGVVTTEAWADPQKQTQFILAHPWEYVRVLGNTLEVWRQKYYEWYIGVLGWLDCWLPAWVYPSYAVMILAVPLLDMGQGRTIMIKERLLLVGVVVATLLLIATSQYITYTIPMDATIRGMQGRYFIPLTIPALMLLYNRKVKVPEKWLGYTVTAFCTVVIVVMCLAILNRYYGINPLNLALKVNIMA
jgi:uncharacterized membrane protein